MSDDDDRASVEPEPEDGDEHATVVRIRVPKWLIVFNVGGTLLAVRMMMTTSYVQAWRLEKVAVLLALVFGFASAIRLALVARRIAASEPGAVPKPVSARQIVVLAGLVALPSVLPLQGFLALANRVGMLENAKVLACKADRVESRARLGGRHNVVHYTCADPAGGTLRGRADELFSIEPGSPITLLAARGRLGVWIRLSSPEPASAR
ncbi:MAG: hypothetical protein JST00_26105 [Deltaproteobacteria bacterium]|nr:hypothetical protein [Deltaproteobacteria bacterium]